MSIKRKNKGILQSISSFLKDLDWNWLNRLRVIKIPELVKIDGIEFPNFQKMVLEQIKEIEIWQKEESKSRSSGMPLAGVNFPWLVALSVSPFLFNHALEDVGVQFSESIGEKLAWAIALFSVVIFFTVFDNLLNKLPFNKNTSIIERYILGVNEIYWKKGGDDKKCSNLVTFYTNEKLYNIEKYADADNQTTVYKSARNIISFIFISIMLFSGYQMFGALYIYGKKFNENYNGVVKLHDEYQIIGEKFKQYLLSTH